MHASHSSSVIRCPPTAILSGGSCCASAAGVAVNGTRETSARVTVQSRKPRDVRDPRAAGIDRQPQQPLAQTVETCHAFGPASSGLAVRSVPSGLNPPSTYRKQGLHPSTSKPFASLSCGSAPGFFPCRFAAFLADAPLQNTFHSGAFRPHSLKTADHQPYGAALSKLNTFHKAVQPT